MFTNFNHKTLLATMVLGASAWMATGATANASDRGYYHEHSRSEWGDRDGRFGVQIALGGSSYGQQRMEGHYETRCETVLVAPEHLEKREIPAVLETRRDYYGRPYTVQVAPARCETVVVPAQYEKREVQVFVPGCHPYAPVTYTPAPVVYGSNSRSGGFLNFFFRN